MLVRKGIEDLQIVENLFIGMSPVRKLVVKLGEGEQFIIKTAINSIIVEVTYK
jgi:hypothetical protein